MNWQSALAFTWVLATILITVVGLIWYLVKEMRK